MLIPLAACRTATVESDRARAQQAILDALEVRGEVAVVVALVDPPGLGDPTRDDSTRAAIARMQDAVVASVDSIDFKETKRFAAVPALAGILRSERGLRRLLALPQVRDVALDTGGGGG